MRTRLPVGGLVSQAFFVAYTLRRLRDARSTGDRLDVLDAAANVLVVATGTVVLLREILGDRR